MSETGLELGQRDQKACVWVSGLLLQLSLQSSYHETQYKDSLERAAKRKVMSV